MELEIAKDPVVDDVRQPEPWTNESKITSSWHRHSVINPRLQTLLLLAIVSTTIRAASSVAAVENHRVQTETIPKSAGNGDDEATRRKVVQVEGQLENVGEGTEHSRECLGGSYTLGTWKLAPDPFSSVAGLNAHYTINGAAGVVEKVFRRRFPTQVRPSASYYWAPDECDLVPFFHEGFCEALNGRSILFVGDSTQNQMFESLVGQVNGHVSLSPTAPFLPSSRVAICPNDPLTGRQIEAAFVRNDHLTVDNPDPGTAPLNVMQAHCQAKDRGIRYPWVQFLDEFDVVVFNTGLHPVGSFKRFEEINRAAVTALDDMGYKGQLIFRNAIPGHTNCQEEARATSGDSTGGKTAKQPFFPKDGNFSMFEAFNDPQWSSYHWDDMSEYNQIAKKIWSEAGATIIDGTEALRLRPDGHMKPPKDCLHYSLPGPPDLWSLLLFNTLLGRIS